MADSKLECFRIHVEGIKTRAISFYLLIEQRSVWSQIILKHKILTVASALLWLCSYNFISSLFLFHKISLIMFIDLFFHPRMERWLWAGCSALHTAWLLLCLLLQLLWYDLITILRLFIIKILFVVLVSLFSPRLMILITQDWLVIEYIIMLQFLHHFYMLGLSA